MRCLLLVLLVACGGGHQQPARPAFKSDVDQVLAVKPAPRDVAAPDALALVPWRVGQWALYRMTSKGHVGYMRYQILAQDTCGLWFEQTIADPSHQLVIKLCLPSPPDLASAAQATVQVDGGAATAMTPPPKDLTLVGAGWERTTNASRENITVPAGRFAGTVTTTTQLKGVATTVWSHPAVPLAGMVKAETANGVVTELVDYGPL